MATQIQLRRGTAALWTSTNPTLAEGEFGYETDTTLFKIGDGTTAWASLAYNAPDLSLYELLSNKVTSISGASTDNQYPSAKLVYDQLALKAPLASPSFTGVFRVGTATTADVLADSLFAATATTQKGLVVQMKAGQTAHIFSTQTSAGVACVSVQSDGGLIIDQRGGATYTRMLDVLYQGTRLFDVGAFGDATAARDLILAAATGKINIGSGRIHLQSSGLGILEQYNSTNDAQTYQIYNTRTNSSNYERGFMKWNSNVFEIGTEAAGTGTLRAVRLVSSSGTLQFQDANGYIRRTSTSNTMEFSASGAATHMQLTAAGLFPGVGETIFKVEGLSSSTSGVLGTFTVRPADRGGNPGVGHTLEIRAGAGSTATTGTSGGAVTLRGGAAGGSGNNNGGSVTIEGGAPTGTGVRGFIILSNLPTSSAGLTTGALWNNAGVLNIV